MMRKRGKKAGTDGLPVLVLAGVFALVLAGCSGKKEVIIKVGDTWNAAHPVAQAMDTIFKTQVESASNGEIKVEIYHDGVLGNEKDLWDGVRNGTLEMVVVGSGMNQEYTTMLISDWPFLYRDIAHAKAVWTGQIAEDINVEFNKKFPSVYVLGWGPNSARTFTSSKKLSQVDDFKGQKFRMPSNPIHIAIANSLGGSAQVIPLGDLFSALETGVVDGQDNGMVTVRSQNFFEVQKYLYETNHIIATLEVIASAPFLDALSAEHQDIVKNAATAAVNAAWDAYILSIDEDRAFLAQKGMIITPLTPSDQALIIEKLKPLTDKLYQDNAWARPLTERIRALE